MKIGFISLDHLRDWNGITRLIDRIASAMSERGHMIVIFVLEAKASSKIPVSALSYPHELVTFGVNGGKIDSEAREKIAASGAEICVTSIGGRELLYMPWLFRGSDIPYIIGEPFDPRIFTYERWSPYEHFGALYSAAAVQVLLPQYLPYYPEVLQKNISVIGNPVGNIESDNSEPISADKDIKTIISVGRFNDDDKRFSLLLRAFAILHNDFPDWRLKLVGDGPYWEYYHIMSEQLGLKKSVEFTGATADVNSHYKEADIFCLPSRGEGFPMVLTEAAAHSLPLAGYKTCLALNALIEPEMGVLAESEDGDTPLALAQKLRTLMELTPEERQKIGATANEKLKKAYGDEVIFAKWEELIKSTAEKAASKRRFEMKDINEIKPEWDGLTPTSPVWTEELLSNAAAEIASRTDPLTAAEESTADEATESIRLRCELAKSKQDYSTLEKKYNSLLAQFQAGAIRKQPPKSGKKKR